MDTILTQLQKTVLFQDIPPKILQDHILSYGQLQPVVKNQVLIEPQQQVDQLGIVISGKIHLQHMFPDGTYSLINSLRPTYILGSDLIFTPKRTAPYHAIAAIDSSIFFLPAELLTDPTMLPGPYRLQIITQLLFLVSNHNMKKEYRLAILAQKGLRERIMTYLTMQASRRQTNTFQIPFNREELASYLCVNRSALSHELSKMEHEGLISFHKDVFTVRTIE